MEITVSEQMARVPVTVFHVQGDIDTQSYEQFQQQALHAIQGGTRYLLVDLSQVSYISSYGIRALSQVFNWMKEEEPAEAAGIPAPAGTVTSAHLKLACANPAVQNVLAATGLSLYLDTFADVKQAISAF